VPVNADVHAQGDFAAPRITGTLRIEQGRIEVDRVLETTTKDVYSTRPQTALDEGAPAQLAAEVSAAPAAPASPAGSLFSRVDLALRLTVPDNLVLRGRALRVASSSMGLGDMNIVTGGELDLRKTPGGSLGITGSMEVVRGYYSFQGRRFEVERGSTVRFRGQSPIDPALSIQATRLISGVTARVAVQGALSDPRVALSSDPPLDQADVLSLIVFGQPVNDLGLSQRTSLSERAASMAASAIATPVADSVARALNLDLFEIQTQGTSGATVSLGSQIGTRLYVGLKQDVGQGDSTALSLEYRFADFVRLVTSIVQGSTEKNAASQLQQQSGLDLIFLFRY
jgi:translocation and assembly module TamB